MAKLNADMKDAILTEFENDPENRGYAQAATSEEKAALFNQPYSVEVVVVEQRTARANVVLAGITSAPNAISAEDIDAL